MLSNQRSASKKSVRFHALFAKEGYRALLVFKLRFARGLWGLVYFVV